MPRAAASTIFFDAATARGAFSAIRSAQAMAASRAPPDSVTSLSIPASSASSAVIGSPVTAISMAFVNPTLAGRRISPPPAAKRPTLTSRMPIFAPFEATRRSQVSASSHPPARAKPSIAQISGFWLPAWIKSIIGPMSSPRAKAFRSIPEQKPRPLPVSTPAVRESSASSSFTAFQRPFDSAPLMAFMASGRLSRMIRTRPRLSTSTASSVGVSLIG